MCARSRFGPEAHATASRLHGESVIRVKGVVGPRPEGTVNPNLATGEIEVTVSSLEVLSDADTPPFLVEDGEALLRLEQSVKSGELRRLRML